MDPHAVIAALGGTQDRAAKRLGVTQGAISHWVQMGSVPLVRQYQIEVLTEGELRAERRERAAKT